MFFTEQQLEEQSFGLDSDNAIRSMFSGTQERLAMYPEQIGNFFGFWMVHKHLPARQVVNVPIVCGRTFVGNPTNR